MDSKTQLRQALEALPDSAWTVGEVTDEYIRSWTQIEIAGTLSTVWRTQYVEDETLQAANRQMYNDSEGKRWGDGRMVARIPLNVVFDENRQIAEKMREGDRDHLKHWLNSDDAKPFRTFKGTV